MGKSPRLKVRALSNIRQYPEQLKQIREQQAKEGYKAEVPGGALRASKSKAAASEGVAPQARTIQAH